MKTFIEFITEEKKSRKRNFIRDFGGSMILAASLANAGKNIQTQELNPHQQLTKYAMQFVTKKDGKSTIDLDKLEPHEYNHLNYLIRQAKEYSESRK